MEHFPERCAFDRREFEARLKRIRARMAEKQVDVLCITSPENMFYVSGYDAWSFYTHQMVILHIDESEPLWVGREIDVPCAKATCWLSNTSIYGYGDKYVDSTEQHAMEFIADLLRQKGWSSAKLGFEYENYYFTAKSYLTLKHELPQAFFVDCTNLVNWVRVVKSPLEIEYMKQAGNIADATMRAGFAAMRPGVRECDVAAAFNAAQANGIPEFAGDPQTEVTVISVGNETTCPHLTWTDRLLPAQGPINVELGGVRRRYNAAISRSFHIGKVPNTLQSLADVTMEACQLTLDQIRPGITAESVWQTYNKALSKHGEKKPSRVGYSIGIGYTPSWIERTISFGPGDSTILQSGMTFHLMCGMWLNKIGFVQSETIIVTECGFEPLTSYPRGLQVID